MKKFSLVIGAAGLLWALTAQAAYDGTIKIVTRTYGNGPGGVFQAHVETGVSSLITAGGYFDTFCLEHGEGISFGGIYGASINSKAINGSVLPPGVGDPLSLVTAYLYANFRNGTLAGYTYGSAASADALQAAFWWMEGEADGVKNSFVTGAVTALGLGAYDDAGLQGLGSGGAYGVVALNLYNPDGSVAQDQLGLVPEPSTVIAAALLLLPFGASTIRILRKNRVTQV